jgi:cation transport ATPase
MEQYEDIKNELQQELQDLQQNVEQHSSFNKEVWQRAVKRHSRHLYWQNVASVILSLTLMTVSNIILVIDNVLPWWFAVILDLFIGWLLLESLIVTNGLRKANVQDREGLLSLRESVRKSTTVSKRKRIILISVGLILLIVVNVFFFLHQQYSFIFILIGLLIAIPITRKRVMQAKEQYNDLGEEIDELLKE